MIKSIYSLLFFYFCALHSKEVVFELEGEFPNLSTIKIMYLEQRQDISREDLLAGIEKGEVCTIEFFSNMKDPLDVILTSKSAIETTFFFNSEEKGKKVPFYLFNSKDHKNIKDGDVIFSQGALKEPTKQVLTLGMKIPSVSKSKMIAGAFSSQFSVTLKDIG